MPFEEHQVVRANVPIGISEWDGSDGVVPEGTTGTIVSVYKANPPAYEVEFFNSDKNSLGLGTVREGQIEAFTPEDSET